MDFIMGLYHFPIIFMVKEQSENIVKSFMLI